LDNAPIVGIPECEIPEDADELEAPNELHRQIHYVDPQPDDNPDLLSAGHPEGLYIPPAVIDLPIESSIQEETQQEENPNIPPPVLRSSNRFRAPNPWLNRVYYDLRKGERSAEPNILGNASNEKSNSAIFKGPSTVSQAIESSDSDAWTDAMQQEYDSLIKNDTWDLVPLPPNRKPISTRWIFKVKQHADGSIDRFKARFVVRGYSQVEGIDYDETFAPVGRFGSLRVLLAIACQENLEIHMMDVDSAFLNGVITEDIYITQPEGFIDADHPDYVCKLKKSLYGLKQAPRVWNITIDSPLQENGFKNIMSDPCIYVRNNSHGRCIIFIYVDDLLIFCPHHLLQDIKQIFTNRFNMKDLGEATNVLNMVIHRNRKAGTLTLSQPGYIKDLLSTFGMEHSRPVATPLDPGTSLPKITTTPTDAEQLPYRQAVGKLTWAATGSRPDIAFSTSLISRHMSAYNKSHWSAVKRILRYLTGTVYLGLTFQRSPRGMILQGYSDADWGGDKDDRKSTSGYLFILCNAPVTWASKKQSTVALSSTEAEYLAASAATKEALWLRKLLTECGYPQSKPTIIFEDNQGCIAISQNPSHHPRTKHFDIQHHFVREKVQSGEIILKYCPSDRMLADFLTKPLNRNKLTVLRDKAGIHPTFPDSL